MVTVLLDFFSLLMQTISALALVYGAFLAFVLPLGKDAPRPEAGITPARRFRVGGTGWNQ